MGFGKAVSGRRLREHQISVPDLSSAWPGPAPHPFSLGEYAVGPSNSLGCRCFALEVEADKFSDHGGGSQLSDRERSWGRETSFSSSRTASPALVVADSYATQLAAVGADPGNGVPADPPLILLHTAETDLEAASTGPAKLLLLAAAVTLVSLDEALPMSM